MEKTTDRPAVGLASWITLSRLLLLPLAVVPVVARWPGSWLVAAAVTTVAGLSDVVDGHLARRLKQTSRFGAMLDLSADKVFIVTVLGVLAYFDAIPLWMVIVVAARELLISLLRLFGQDKRRISPNAWGKAKTVLTFVAIVSVMLEQHLNTSATLTGLASQPVSSALLRASWLMTLAVALTVLSGVNYLAAWSGVFRRSAGNLGRAT